MKEFSDMKKQNGAVMLVSLVLLTILFLVTTTGLRTGVTESQMTGNEQVRLEAFERAQSIVESVIVNTANFPVSGNVGDTNCLNIAGCTESTVAVDSGLMSGAYGARTSVEITRLAPLYSPPPRGMASSASLFQVASMQVEATYDGASEKLGKSIVGQGLVVLVAK